MYTIIGSDGNQYGPITAEQLRQWAQEGRVTPDTKVQSDGGEWKPLSAYPEFAGVFGAASGGAVLPPVPGVASGVVTNTAKIPNYLVQSILVTLCCCLPFGIPAIVFASQVNTKLGAGDMAGAMESSAKAKKWCWIAFGLGIVSGIIGFVLQILIGMASMQVE